MARRRTTTPQDRHPSILVAIPYEPGRSPVWPRIASDLAARLPQANPGITFTVALHPCERTHAPGDGKFSANARARNSLLDAHLSETYSHVLWVDSDLINYPADLPSRLLALNPHGISAPAVVLARHGARFYDILGFVEGGRGFQMHQPWCSQPGPVVELDSVGCIYLAPASLYRVGVRYADAPGYTEHMSVMREAKAAGLRICADLSITAVHAWLPDYGEAIHQ